MDARLNKFFLLAAVIGSVSFCMASDTLPAEPKAVFPEVGAGLTYVHERIGDEPWSIHVLKIDRSRKDLQFTTTLANQTVFGLELLTSQVEKFPAELGKPLAAVNGGYFGMKEDPYQGDPCGILIRRGEIISGSKGQGFSFWIDAQDQPKIGLVKSQFQITWPNDTKTSFSLNQRREKNMAVLYTPTLGDSTRTEGGVELVLGAVDADNWLPLQSGSTIRAKVESISKTGNTPLNSKIMVFSIGAELAETLPTIKIGDKVTISMATCPEMKNVKTAIAGNTLLLKDGQIVKHKNNNRHPRTLIGWNDKLFFFVVVDGRQEGLSKGMSFQEESELMLRLGATEAVNFDGGGSSVFWLDGKIMNSPSDGPERPVSDGLLLLRTPARAITTSPAKKR